MVGETFRGKSKLLFLLVFFSFMLFSLPVESLTDSASVSEFKTMLILGSHNEGTRINRVNEAYKLIQQGNFENIIVTGGCGAHDTAADNCEAQHMAQLLLQKGVSADKIILEEKAKSTGGNYKYSRELILPQTSGIKVISPNDKLLVVSSSENVKAVAYCFRYKDQVDAYYVQVPDSYTPAVIPVNYDGGSYSSMVNGCRPSGQQLVQQQSQSQPQQQHPQQQYPQQQQQYLQQQQGQSTFIPKPVLGCKDGQRCQEVDQVWSERLGPLMGKGNLIFDHDTKTLVDYKSTYFEERPSLSSGYPSGNQYPGTYNPGQITPGYPESQQQKIYGPTGGGNEFNSIIIEAGQNYGVEPELIKGIMRAESSTFNPNAASGCSGLMQVCGGSAKPEYIKLMCDQKKSTPTLCDPNNCKPYKIKGIQWCENCKPGQNNCISDDRFDPYKNIMSGTATLKRKIVSVGKAVGNQNGDCGTDKVYAWITTYNMGNLFVDDAIKRVGNCNDWDQVMQELYQNTDFNTNTYTMMNGKKHKKSWLDKGKLDRKRKTGSYTGKAHSAYLGYKKYGLSGDGSSATTSGSTAPYQGTYTGQAQVKDPNCLILYGDTRNPTPRQKIALESIKRECANPSLFHVGDFVDEGESAKAWEQFLDYERDLIKQGTLYAIVGNHEDRKTYAGKGYQAIADHLGGEFPYIKTQMSNGGHYMVPITSNLIAIILNTEGNCNFETQFLKQQLNANPNKGVMLGYHKPAYPHIHTTHGNGCAKKWHKLLVEHKNKGNKVLAFAGDTHGLARVIRDGVTHLEVGAMLKTRPCLSPQGGAFCKQERGYYRCDANLHCVAKNENGKTLDQFDVN